MKVYSDAYKEKLNNLVKALNEFTFTEASKMMDVDKIFAVHAMDMADKTNAYLKNVHKNNVALKVEIK